MTQTCPACGSAVDESARFCTECGRPLDAEAPAAQPAVPQPPPAAAPPAPPAQQPQPPQQPPVYSQAPQHGRPPGYGHGGPPPRQEAPALIPYHNQPALIGYYLSVFSLIPCLGLPLGIAAIVLGAIGLRKHREDPTVKGKGHAITALVLGGITTLLWGALAVLAFYGAALG